MGDPIFDESAAKSVIRDVKDYPKKGILFKDITPLLKEPEIFKSCIDELAAMLKGKKADYIVGLESRGFIVGAPLAMEMGIGFVPIRKQGKLPHVKIEKSYDLEYGSATIEMHIDAIKKGQSVIIVDDLLASGGTAAAAAHLVESAGGKVTAFAFMIELESLKGRTKLNGEIVSLLKY